MPWPPNDPEILAALEAAWRDGSWGVYDGPNSERLARALAELHGVEHLLLCSSGTFAVELALRAVGVCAGDEVMLAGYDFPGNFRAIEAISARPVLVDIVPATWSLDPAQIAAAASPATKAILVSHLHGGLAPMAAICKEAARLGLAVVEDACQAAGAIIDGRLAGSWGDAGVLSFGGSKLLTSGRGGAVLTRRDDVQQRAKVFCDRGNHAFPLSELQAAVLVPQVASLESKNILRWQNVRRLLTATEDLAELTPIAIPAASDAEFAPPSFYKLAWLWNSELCGERPREAFIDQMRLAGFALDAGFRGFAGRSNNRCRKPMPLPHSARAAADTVILHHPILLDGPAAIDRLAASMRQVVSQLRDSAT